MRIFSSHYLSFTYFIFFLFVFASRAKNETLIAVAKNLQWMKLQSRVAA